MPTFEKNFSSSGETGGLQLQSRGYKSALQDVVDAEQYIDFN